VACLNNGASQQFPPGMAFIRGIDRRLEIKINYLAAQDRPIGHASAAARWSTGAPVPTTRGVP
jgi:hypothetical protein